MQKIVKNNILSAACGQIPKSLVFEILFNGSKVIQ